MYRIFKCKSRRWKKFFSHSMAIMGRFRRTPAARRWHHERNNFHGYAAPQLAWYVVLGGGHRIYCVAGNHHFAGCGFAATYGRFDGNTATDFLAAVRWQQ